MAGCPYATKRATMPLKRATINLTVLSVYLYYAIIRSLKMAKFRLIRYITRSGERSRTDHRRTISAGNCSRSGRITGAISSGIEKTAPKGTDFFLICSRKSRKSCQSCQSRKSRAFSKVAKVEKVESRVKKLPKSALL